MAQSPCNDDAEKPAEIRFLCSRAQAERLEYLKRVAERNGVEIDMDGRLAVAMDRLIAQIEEDLSDLIEQDRREAAAVAKAIEAINRALDSLQDSLRTPTKT
jgi:hypothetical protein